MNERSGHALRFAQPLRTLAQRSAFLLLLGGAVGLMLLGKTDPQVFDRARTTLTDVTAPILNVISRPATSAEALVEEGRQLIAIRAENDRLRVENQRLLHWQAVARKLEHENTQLRALLNLERQDARRFVTGRVIGFGGAFVRSVLLNVGAERGVRKGQAAVSGVGLLGRVAEVGERSARVLLITDLNSRIPVMIEETRVRAILAGDNTRAPRLVYLSANSELATGQRVVTSGHGGAFPPGVPVGRIVAVGENGVRVEPFAGADRLEFVRVMDFGLGGILAGDGAEAERAARAEAAAAAAAAAAAEVAPAAASGGEAGAVPGTVPGTVSPTPAARPVPAPESPPSPGASETSGGPAVGTTGAAASD